MYKMYWHGIIKGYCEYWIYSYNSKYQSYTQLKVPDVHSQFWFPSHCTLKSEHRVEGSVRSALDKVKLSYHDNANLLQFKGPFKVEYIY